jgi:hypothetical protein
MLYIFQQTTWLLKMKHSTIAGTNLLVCQEKDPEADRRQGDATLCLNAPQLHRPRCFTIKTHLPLQLSHSAP